jgi:hypothetical protein
MIARFISGLSLAIPTCSVVASNDINTLYLPQVFLSVDDERGQGGSISPLMKISFPTVWGSWGGHRSLHTGTNVNTLKGVCYSFRSVVVEILWYMDLPGYTASMFQKAVMLIFAVARTPNVIYRFHKGVIICR